MTRPEVESAETFAVNACMHPTCSGGDKRDVCCEVLADLVRKRDAAIRAAALIEAEAACSVYLEQLRANPDTSVVAEWAAQTCVSRIRSLATKGPSK